MKHPNRGNFFSALPLLAIAWILGMLTYLKHQSQAALPDYDDPTSEVAMPLSTQPPISQPHSVKEVTDGDTIVLENGEVVRLCGIFAPKLSQPLGAESRENLKRLIDAAGGEVMVAEHGRDRREQIVAEVFVKRTEDEALLNLEQLESGMASLYEQPAKNCMNGSLFPDAENRAKASQKGIWKN